MKWTADQQKAIGARKGTLLVSAAAGSGKTAVLVERVIQRICDSENPCDVENLLIVTFTNAAAAQMKEKIHAAIGKKIAENPDDKRLRRQQLMLPCASICTIDSFCIGLVRENFHALGISPDFALLDEGKLSILRSQAVNTVVDKMHEEKRIRETAEFKEFVEAQLRNTRYAEYEKRIMDAEFIISDTIWDSSGGILEYAIRHGLFRTFYPWFLYQEDIG